MQQRETHEHTLEPIYNKNSRILILGSFPSVKSREIGFYYGHKFNRFWSIMESLFSIQLTTIDEKKSFLDKNNIALWDVISSCSIIGSSDADIEDVVPNDIEKILSIADIKAIFTNGKKAYELYNKHILPQVNREAIPLPSTSPTNATWNMERLINAWSVVKDILDMK